MCQVKIELSEIDKSILPWLGRAVKALDITLVDAFASHGLSLTKAQMILLKRLVANDGIPQNDLAFITNRDKTSLTRLITTMENKGLVERKSSTADKRINLIFITEFGKETLKSAFPILMEMIENIQHNIDKRDLEITINVLKQLSININADELTAPLTITK